MLLMYKLRRIGVSGLLYNATETVYEQTECYVNINNIFTDKFTAEARVRQDDPLSSNLFGMYINDFPSFITEKLTIDANTDSLEISCSLFADDIVLIAKYEYVY